MEPDSIANLAYKSYKNQKTLNLTDHDLNSSRIQKKKNFPLNLKILPRKTLWLSQSFDDENRLEKSDLLKFKNKIGLAPIGKEVVKEKKSVILGKNKALLFMIDNFLGKSTGNSCQQMELTRNIEGNERNCKDGYEKTVEYCCGDGYKEYQNDLDKNMKIEKFRLGNYRRNRRRRSLIL